MSPEDLAYLAGFVDGEGCIFGEAKTARTSLTRKYHYYPALHVGQKFPGILYWIQSTTGIGRVIQRSDKTCYTWKCSGSKCSSLLVELLPYLKVKKIQAEIAIKLGNSSPDEREALYRHLKLLKRQEGVTSE